MMKDGACNRKNYMNNCNQTSYVYTYTPPPPFPCFSKMTFVMSWRTSIIVYKFTTKFLSFDTEKNLN